MGGGVGGQFMPRREGLLSACAVPSGRPSASEPVWQVCGGHLSTLDGGRRKRNGGMQEPGKGS